jgi:hypothetical protein
MSVIDDFVFFCDDVMFMLYVDDCIFLGSDNSHLQEVIKENQDQGLNIEDLSINKLKDGSYEFTQRVLIDSIIDDVGLKDAEVKPVPAKVSLKLHAFKDEPLFDLNFNYRSAVGKLNYLVQTTRPDIMYTMHQIAK